MSLLFWSTCIYSSLWKDNKLRCTHTTLSHMHTVHVAFLYRTVKAFVPGVVSSVVRPWPLLQTDAVCGSLLLLCRLHVSCPLSFSHPQAQIPLDLPVWVFRVWRGFEGGSGDSLPNNPPTLHVPGSPPTPQTSPSCPPADTHRPMEEKSSVSLLTRLLERRFCVCVHWPLRSITSVKMWILIAV